MTTLLADSSRLKFVIFYRQSKSIAVTSMAFPNNEINNFILGSEDGCVYSGILKKIF